MVCGSTNHSPHGQEVNEKEERDEVPCSPQGHALNELRTSQKVKSWRDTGDTPCRKDHQEEAKL
jgi:hypothetical protein